MLLLDNNNYVLDSINNREYLIQDGGGCMNKAINNRTKFIEHIMKTFPFEETGAAGVYYDVGLKAVMAVAGNEVSLEFQEGTRSHANKKKERGAVQSK